MYPCDNKTLERLLTLIERDDYKLALKTWAEHRNKTDKSCSRCPYKASGQAGNCCLCLESKLRTLSLYQHGASAFEKSLVDAARKLGQYGQNAR